jgi:hypothetical protein
MPVTSIVPGCGLMLRWSLVGLGCLVLVVFGDGQGEGGGVDLKVEPVGGIDRVAVELHRLGAVTTDLHLGGPEGVHIGAGLVAADQNPRCHPDPIPERAGLQYGDVELAVVGDSVGGGSVAHPGILPRLATSTPWARRVSSSPPSNRRR